METKYYAAIMLIGATLLTGCKNENGAGQSSPVRVSVQKVVLTPINGTQDFSGTVEEVSGTALSFTTGGTVKEIFVSQGQMVKSGALLAEVDETSLRNAYEATAATREQAEDAYARMKQLHDNNSLPEIQWMEVQSKLKQAIAAEQIAKKSLTDTKLYAPYSGFIADKLAEVGQNVLPGAPIVKLVKIDQVKVKIAVPENEIALIKKGEAVRVNVSALGGKTFEGTVTEKGVTAHPLSRSYEVKALVKNPEGDLLPGMVCDVSLNKTEESKAIVLPTHVVSIDGQNRNFVWLNVGEKATKRIIQTGKLTTNGVIVESGLSEGDEVIVSGQQKVSEGSALMR
ncbi:MAG: efflux RND transporter periplasmic adaptor subunit [Bacteroides sp.]|nr:efflux RND transporter periplasmic adaptor subunit [Bacteroides sp.]